MLPREGRGTIYGASLELLEEQLYRLNIKSPNSAKVAVEMEKAQLALDQWINQKTLFYIFDLNVDRDDLDRLEKAAGRSGEKILRFVAAITQKPSQISQKDYDQGGRAAMNEEQATFLDIAGQSGVEEAKKFRAAFNKNLFVNFGTSINITGF